jgi:hypothetical protein
MAFGQTSGGFIGGINLASITFDPDPGIDFTTRTGFGFGGIVDFSFNETVGLRVEPMYLQKGTEAEEEGVELVISADYIEIPILLRYAVPSKNVRLFFMGGPTLGFNLSAKMKVSFQGQTEEDDMKDQIKSMDFGLAFGMGILIPAGQNTVFVEGRYSLGLSNINDDPDDAATTVKTRGIQIFAGMTFPLGM